MIATTRIGYNVTRLRDRSIEVLKYHVKPSRNSLVLFLSVHYGLHSVTPTVTHMLLYNIQQSTKWHEQSNNLGEDHIERIVYLFRINEFWETFSNFLLNKRLYKKNSGHI